MIVIENLTKKFDDQVVLNQVNLHVEKGVAFGIYGKKESGKTTLLRVLMHSLYPTEGRCSIAGFDCNTQEDEVHKRVAYIPENPQFYDHLTVAENIRFGTDGNKGYTAQEKKALLESFALDPKAMGWELSRREKSKLATVIALLRKPPIFLLDSPFTNLAPMERAMLIRHLHAAKKAGATLLMTSSYEEDLLSFCDEVALMEQGILGEPKEITAFMDHQGVFVKVFGDLTHKEVAQLAYRIAVSTDHEKQFFYRGDLAPLLALLSQKNIQSLEIVSAEQGNLYADHFGGQV